MKKIIFIFSLFVPVYTLGMDEMERYEAMSSDALEATLATLVCDKKEYWEAFHKVRGSFLQNLTFLRTQESEDRFPNEVARAQGLDSEYAQLMVGLVHKIDVCDEHEQVIRHIQNAQKTKRSR